MTIRRGLLVSLFLLPGFLGGCSLFRHEAKPSVEVEAPAAPEPKAQPPVPKNDGSGKKSSTSTKRSTTPAGKPVAKVATSPDTLAVPSDSSLATPDLPEHRPIVSAVLTPELRSTLEARYRTDVERANLALDSLKGRTLTVTQVEQRGSAERFLAESRATFETGDLPRAASLVEKARVIAEELKSGTSPN